MLECDGHMYGQNCSEHCGKCRNNTQCHHLNGSCFSGCVRGSQGDRCNKGTDLKNAARNVSFNMRCQISKIP